MSISRRSFIAGIFAAASAPAIVKANNLMKLNSGILVPDKPYKIITLPLSRIMQLGLDYDGDVVTINNGCSIEKVVISSVNSNSLNIDNEMYVHTDFIRPPINRDSKLKELTRVR